MTMGWFGVFEADMARHVRAKGEAEAEIKRVLDQLGKALPRLGFDLVPVAVAKAKPPRTSRNGDARRLQPGKYRCAFCGAKFGHWLHRGRHMSVKHPAEHKAWHRHKAWIRAMAIRVRGTVKKSRRAA